MKYSELHRIIIKSGWKFLYARGSHYFYEKDGVKSEPIPFHGSKEIKEPIKRKILRDLNIQ